MQLDLSHLAMRVKEEESNDAPTRVRLVQTARGVEFARLGVSPRAYCGDASGMHKSCC